MTTESQANACAAYERDKARQAKRRREFRLNEVRHELAQIPVPERCPVLGLKLDSHRPDNRPSNDRLDSRLPYTVLENVHKISWRANRIKNRGTPDSLLRRIGKFTKNGFASSAVDELHAIREYMIDAPGNRYWQGTDYARDVEERETIPWLLDAVEQPDGTFLCNVDRETFEEFFIES